MKPMFTPEELAELARIDAELEAEPVSMAELAESRARDRLAQLEGMDNKHRKLAEYQREYYAANREKRAEYQREYYAANREELAEYQREYYAANREKIAERRRIKTT